MILHNILDKIDDFFLRFLANFDDFFLLSITAYMHKREMPEKVQNLVQFRYLDATQACFPEDYFDVVYSRDAIMHIADKEPLYEKILVGIYYIYFNKLLFSKLEFKRKVHLWYFFHV